jgi:predicted nucleic acid-binding Zn ribbon protein
LPNPIRSEAGAFRMLIYMVAAIAVIVVVVLAIRTLA